MSATDATPDLEAAVAPEVNATETARQEIKDKEHERMQAKAKAVAEAETARLATDPAAAEKARLAEESKAAEKAKESGKASNLASITAASMLAQICERAFMEHQLAARHFTFYSFWVFFLPLNIIIATTSILAFIAGDSDMSDNNSKAFNILVGCIAAVGVFWNSCDRMLSYKSRADMHTGAKMVCKELLADLDFALIKYRSHSKAERHDPKNDPMSQEALNDIKTKIDQVQESCTSSVPDAINQVFKQMNSLVVFDLDIKGLADGSTEDIQLVRLANVLLSKEITKSLLWPMKLPGAAVCKNARDALFEEYTIKDSDLGELRKKQRGAEAKKQEAAGASAP